MGEAAGTIKEYVVPDNVLIEYSAASTNDRFAVLAGVPCNADLWREVIVGLVHTISLTGQEVVQCLNRVEVAVRAAGIANVAQAIGQRDVGPNPPAVSNIKAKAIIGSEAARRKTKGLAGRREALTVADDGGVDGVVKRAVLLRLATRADKSSKMGKPHVGRRIRDIATPRIKDARRNGEELREAATLQVV